MIDNRECDHQYSFQISANAHRDIDLMHIMQEHTSMVCTIILEQNATCTITHNQQIKDNHQKKITLRIVQYPASLCVFQQQMHIEGVFEQHVIFELAGTSAQALYKAAWQLYGSGRADLQTHQQHLAPESESQVVIKEVVHDAAYTNYQGCIVIERSATGSNARQDNKVLLVSPTARADSTPSIEVHTHRVQCGHGSAIGRMDPEQLLYLQSRGLAADLAKNILKQAFLELA